MPYFIRTRKLDLRRLERKPQESLSIVHTILEQSVKEVQKKLLALESAYYGPGGTAYSEISKWAPSVKTVMRQMPNSEITSVEQLDDMVKKANSPDKTFALYTIDVSRTKNFYYKVKEYVPDRFSDMLVDLRTILKYLEKYCLSFYELDADVYLETAAHYERSRQEWLTLIRENLFQVVRAPEKFIKENLYISSLSPYAIELARREELTSAPFVVLFPEAVHCVRLVCDAMMAWIKADAGFPVYMKNDVSDLEKAKSDSLTKFREGQDNFYQMTYRLTNLEEKCNKLNAQLDQLSGKEMDLMYEEEFLASESNELQLEIELKEFRRDELIKEASTLHHDILHERYAELSAMLRDLRLRLPIVQRSLAGVKYKLSWLSEKKSLARKLKKQLEQLRKEVSRLETEKLEAEVEVFSTEQALEHAKQILLYKTSQDVLKKIYHEQPVEVCTARLPGRRSLDDPFERACRVVADNIDTDWAKMYRNLPFHPGRGRNTIDADVREFTNTFARDPPEILAMRCLHRWRRFHTRAKLEDMKEALAKIKRNDVITLIDLDLNPPEPEVPQEEEPPSFLDPELLECYRQVERFDELRASQKI